MSTKIYKSHVRKKSKSEINDLVGTADFEKMFSKSDTTTWSYKLYEIKKIIKDTFGSCRLDVLPERYNEALVKKKTESTMKKIMRLWKKIKLNQTFVVVRTYANQSLYLFVKTKAEPYIPAGATTSKANSTLTDWPLSNFFLTSYIESVYIITNIITIIRWSNTNLTYIWLVYITFT